MDTSNMSEITALKELIVKQDTMIEAQKDLIASLKELLAIQTITKK
jgi:hypothetical protein